MNRDELEDTLAFYTRTSILLEEIAREICVSEEVDFNEVSKLEKEVDGNIRFLYYIRRDFNRRKTHHKYVDNIDNLIDIFNYTKRHVVTLGNKIHPNRITLPIMG